MYFIRVANKSSLGMGRLWPLHLPDRETNFVLTTTKITFSFLHTVLLFKEKCFLRTDNCAEFCKWLQRNEKDDLAQYDVRKDVMIRLRPVDVIELVTT